MANNKSPAIVGIGASAGGVRALQSFFEALPDDTGAAFVVILHLDPETRSELAEIIAARTRMPVSRVDSDAPLRPDHVYVIAPNRELRISDHAIATLPFNEPRGQRAPIDAFFRSLAAQHADGFAVVLTGAGEDGTIGVRAVKEAGGIVLVQDPGEAEYASMPRSAIATESADVVLPVRELAGRLAELIHRRDQVILGELQDSDEEVLHRILAHLRLRLGHDFSHYKRATVLRRILRRMQVARQETLADYHLHMRDTPEEAQALFEDFLISVTTFFRDRKAFEALGQSVVPQLFEHAEPGAPIRVWAAGCATGEEAYSIGMLLLEEAARREHRPELQVFGSDLDAGALTIAREGRYPATIESDVSEERLRRFFHREGEHYRVRRELRDIILFANHSLLKDPPFSRVDLVCCRNLLIYLDRELQQHVCNTLHYALRPGGYLFLGASEAAEHPPGLFRVVDRDARIYQSLARAGERRLPLPTLLGNQPAFPLHGARRGTPPSGGHNDAFLHRQALERLAPPSILVDETHRAVHLSESAGRYLQPAGGPATTDAIELVRQELRFDLRAALHRAFERGEASLTLPILVGFNGHHSRVYLQVRPVREAGAGQPRHALVLFIEGEAVEQAVPSREEARDATDTTRRLQEELQLTQALLKATREESEAANEDLRAANEELQSINEEYRSTSEELETSKEELQSINEELQTVNSELKLKLESVSRAHSDLQNLMAATDFGVLFLDSTLRIKRFTPRITDLINITATDESRPITDFTHHLDYEDLAADARRVIRELAPIEREIRSRQGHWYLVRLRPYRTVDDRIDGVVVTFVDITERRQVEEALRESEERLRQQTRLVELSRAPIFVWDFDGGVVEWNRGSERLYGYSRAEALGKRKDVLLQTIVPDGSFEALKRALLDSGGWSGELHQHTKDGRRLTVESHLELTAIAGRRLVLESTRDITERKSLEARQQLLLGELSHRVKNTLAVVQSIAHQTARNSRSLDQFITAFDGRIAALALAHKLLVDSRWTGAELGELARQQLAPYAGSGARRVQIRGERVALPADLATPFGLLLHELATNAAKYGALSNEEGRITLSWQSETGNHGPLLRVTWRESSGPTVPPPERTGFGSVLIDKGLPGATVQRQFLPEGLLCTIELPMPEATLDERER